MDPTAIQEYAQRQATVSAHQEHIRFHLGFRPFEPLPTEALSRFLRDEATAWNTRRPAGPGRGVSPRPPILLPATPPAPPGWGATGAGAPAAVCPTDGVSARCRCTRASMPCSMSTRTTHLSPSRCSRPPGDALATRSESLTAKLDQIQATGVLALDLSWLNRTSRKRLARHAWPRRAPIACACSLPPSAITVLVCFLDAYLPRDPRPPGGHVSTSW